MDRYNVSLEAAAAQASDESLPGLGPGPGPG